MCGQQTWAGWDTTGCSFPPALLGPRLTKPLFLSLQLVWLCRALLSMKCAGANGVRPPGASQWALQADLARRSLKGLCPHLYLNLQPHQDLWLAGILGSVQTRPVVGIHSFSLQPPKILEGQLQKQPNKSHDDNNPVAPWEKAAVQKGPCRRTQPIQHQREKQ